MKTFNEVIKNVSIEDLIRMKEDIIKEIEKRKETFSFTLETSENFNPEKNGHAYCAFLKNNNGKFQREFISSTGRIYDSKHKYYQTSFRFEGKENDVIEARLEDGSWKNDYREYYIIDNTGSLKSIDSTEAFRIVLNQ